MAIVKMKKLSVIGMKDEEQTLIKELMDLRCVEVESSEEKLRDDRWKECVVKDGDEAGVAHYEQEIAEAEQALDVLMKYGSCKKPMFSARRRVSTSDYEKMLAEQEMYRNQVQEINGLAEELNEAFAEGNAADALVLTLEPWKTYDLPLEETETKSLLLRLGVVPAETDTEALAVKLAEAGCDSAMEVIHEDKEQKYLSLWYFKADEEEVLDLLKSSGYANAPFTNLQGTVQENIEQAKKASEEAAAKREKIVAAIAERTSYKETVEAYHDMMIVLRDRADVRSKLLLTEQTFTFDGWTPVATAKKVEELLSRHTCWYELTEPEEEDDVPVRLSNPKFFSPIEFITEMYSLPSWKEIDPTSIFTIFYIVFFGIMFGDVGYGILLVLLAYVLLKKYKLYEGGAAKLLKVLLYSGFSSIFWGLMFGSIFGDAIPVIANTFFGKTVTIKPLWLDPAKEPMIFLFFSCALGVVHLFVGMGIKAYEQIKEGQFLDACKDVFAWYLIVLGLVAWLFGGSVDESLPGIGKVMTIIGIAAALILPFITNKGISKGLGIWDLYSGITGNLSDILSYSRLLGLGLASTSIAQVFNFLASMGGKSIVGVLMFIVVFALGHALNFSINALGAFVHSCRLQYVEFFGKFYEGGGRAFKPLDKNTKYINVTEEVK